MDNHHITLNPYTYTLLLEACANTAAFGFGKTLHNRIRISGINDLPVHNSLIDMYGKCGRISDAISTFISLTSKDVITWTALIGGCASHGHFNQMLDYFNQMQASNITPNDITFVNILYGCSHAGKLDVAFTLLDTMKTKYKIEPTLQVFDFGDKTD